MSKRHHRISYSDSNPDEAVGPPLPVEIQQRSRQAAELLREWMATDDGYDEEVWPLLEQELVGSRTRIESGG